MADIASEHENAVELVEDALRKLKTVSPNHEFLKYANEMDEATLQEYYDRFGKDKDGKEVKFTASIHANFLVAIRAELQKYGVEV